jgi:hypothetical protein
MIHVYRTRKQVLVNNMRRWRKEILLFYAHTVEAKFTCSVMLIRRPVQRLRLDKIRGGNKQGNLLYGRWLFMKMQSLMTFTKKRR